MTGTGHAGVIPPGVVPALTAFALSLLWQSAQDGGCCPRCCGACWALKQLLDVGLLDDLAAESGMASGWWNATEERVDRGWLKRAWRMTACHDAAERDCDCNLPGWTPCGDHCPCICHQAAGS